MFSVLNLPSGTNKYAYRIHRAVTLPDFQGLGIGTKIFDFFGELYVNRGDKLMLRSTHIRLANHCRSSDKWLEGHSSGKVSKGGGDQEHKYRNYDRKRTPFSFEYVGSDYNNKKHQPIVCVGDAPYEWAKKCLLRMIRTDEFPIVVAGVADIHQVTVWETVARELGIRVELLYISRKGKLCMTQKYLSSSFDLVCIGKDEQEQMMPYKNNIRQLVCFNYNHDKPKLFTKFLPKGCDSNG